MAKKGQQDMQKAKKRSTPDEVEIKIEIPPDKDLSLTITTPDGASKQILSSGGPITLTIQVPPREGEPTSSASADRKAARTAVASRDKWITNLSRQIRSAAARFSTFLAGLTARTPAGIKAFSGRRGWVLFWLSLVIYLFTRLYRIAEYPIYFFTDEAVQTVLAADFLRDGLHDYAGRLLPAFFINGSRYSLGLSVYMQLIPTLLFERSVALTRGVSAIVSATSAVAVALILKRIFKTKVWWAGVLLLGLVPAWFLHSRTAFEYALLVTCFAWMLYFYLLYRTQDARYLYACLIFAALGFYSYNPGQVIIPGFGLLMGVIDFRYHWRRRRTVLKGLGLILLAALPYVRFRLNHPTDAYLQLRTLNSYWTDSTPLLSKLQRFARELLIGLNPTYWFLPSKSDLIRHVMDNVGHFHILMLPFAALGIWRGLRRSSFIRARVLLAALLASLLGGAMVAIGITRVLTFVIPMTVFVGIGLDHVYRWLSRLIRRAVLDYGTALTLVILSLVMLRTAVVDGPLWFRDYGLGGMQFGAIQVSEEIQRYLDGNGVREVILSPKWANGVDVIRRFFFPDDAPVELGSASSVLESRMDLSDQTLFVFTQPEYVHLQEDPKIGSITVQSILPYPDGTPGFYFLKLAYSDEAAAIFEQERLERLKPRVESYPLLGMTVEIEHPYFDSGGLQHIFDHDPFTYVRVYEANPTLLKFSFPRPVDLAGIELTTGSMDFELEIRLYAPETGSPVTYSRSYAGLPDDPTVRIDFDRGPQQASRVEVEILSIRPSDPVKIHIRDLSFFQ
ncbi:MAG: glycosyltransferase family 39 protein [Anaerolineales bacterium]